jgi:drug/metabolite transporter (DMT)-like permease
VIVGGQWAGLALIGLSAASYGSVPVFARLAYAGGTTPLTLLSIRYLACSAALAVLLPLLGSRFLLPPDRRWAGVVCGLLLALLSWAYLSAIGRLPVSVAVLVFFSYPAVVVVASFALGYERASWVKAAAAVTAFVGLALGLDVETGVPLDPVGLGLAALASAVYSVMLIYSTRAARGADGLSLAFQSMVGSALALTPAGLLSDEFVLPSLAVGWFGIAGISAVFLAGIMMFFVGVGRVDPVRAAALTNIEPLVSILCAVLLLGETLTIVQLAGIVLVMVAILVMGR